MRFGGAAVFLVFDLPPPVKDALRVPFPSWRPAGADHLYQNELVAFVAIHVRKRAGGGVRPAHAGEDAEGIHAPIPEHPVLLFHQDGVSFIDIGVVIICSERQLEIVLGRHVLDVLEKVLAGGVRGLESHGARMKPGGSACGHLEVAGEIGEARIKICALIRAGLAEDIVLHPAANPHHCVVQGIEKFLS